MALGVCPQSAASSSKCCQGSAEGFWASAAAAFGCPILNILGYGSHTGILSDTTKGPDPARCCSSWSIRLTILALGLLKIHPSGRPVRQLLPHRLQRYRHARIGRRRRHSRGWTRDHVHSRQDGRDTVEQGITAVLGQVEGLCCVR
jgi:hypothetical protein